MILSRRFVGLRSSGEEWKSRTVVASFIFVSSRERLVAVLAL